MSLGCVLGHQWAGCQCTRCGKARDQDHEWVLAGCRTKCRRCGLIKAITHEWQGCVCRRCGAENHHWLDGICSGCGEKCPHPASTEMWESQFFHRQGQPANVCQRCGASVAKF